MLILNYQSLCQIYLSLLEGIQPRYHIERYTRYHIERYKWYHIDRYERYHLSAILTMRQAMLDKGLLVERDITPEYCWSCREVSLINAMMPLGRCVVHLSTDTLSA